MSRDWGTSTAGESLGLPGEFGRVDAEFEPLRRLANTTSRRRRLARLFDVYMFTSLVVTIGAASVLVGVENLSEDSRRIAALAALEGALIALLSSVILLLYRPRSEWRGSTPEFASELELLKRWTEIEVATRDVARRKLGGQASDAPLSIVLGELISQGVFDADEAEEFRYLSALRNQIVHRSHQLDESEVALARAYAEHLLEKLEPAPRAEAV